MSIVPGTYAAAGLFSTTNAMPICTESCCVRMRISTSGEPPGAEGTMKRIDFSGQAACAAPKARNRNPAKSCRSIAAILGPLAAREIQDRAEDALRHEDDEHHQHHPVDGGVERRVLVAEGEPQPLGEEQRERRAHRRPEHDEHAAGDDAEHHLQADGDARHRVRAVSYTHLTLPT